MQLRISPAQSADTPAHGGIFVDVTFFQKNAHFAAEQCERTCWAPTLQCKAGQEQRGKLSERLAARACVEKITSTKNSAVGLPIRELHTLVYLPLAITYPAKCTTVLGLLPVCVQ